MFRVQNLTLLLVSLTVSIAPVATAEVCNEFFQSTSGPTMTWLGLHPAGQNYGVGQSFTLNCGSRVESVAMHISWGTDYAPVRSLEFGDVIHLSIFKTDGEEMARKDWTIDGGSGSRLLTFQLTADDILLPEGTYIAALWTSVAACGGIKTYTADVVDGTGYRSTTATDLTSYSAHASETLHTIIVDSDVTPAGDHVWGTLKALYQ